MLRDISGDRCRRSRSSSGRFRTVATRLSIAGFRTVAAWLSLAALRTVVVWLSVAAPGVVAIGCSSIALGAEDARTAPAALPSAAAPQRVTRVGSTSVSLTVQPPIQSFTPRADWVEIGRRLFVDRGLSEPRGVSCVGCHAAATAFAGGRIGAAGTARGSRPGHFAARAAPSLLYVRYTPALYFYQDDDANAPEPRGGLFADGRSDSVADAVASPFLNADEMNNGDARRLAGKLAASTHAGPLRQAFGSRLFDEPDAVLKAVGRALEAYLGSHVMAPFDSRYDRYARGQAGLSAQELEGMRLFANPDKGNCASCHVFNPGSSNPTRSLFTDYGYDAVGAPRNRALPDNREPKHFDLGLCETGVDKGWPDASSWCGYFKTPTLRNVATRKRFMHNGVFDSLHQVVEFYATRATDPNHWYPPGRQFDDLPATARGNVNVNSVPYNRREGSKPALDPGEVDAVVAFLQTLTDDRFMSVSAMQRR